jgi:hypothetical protein
MVKARHPVSFPSSNASAEVCASQHTTSMQECGERIVSTEAEGCFGLSTA